MYKSRKEGMMRELTRIFAKSPEISYEAKDRLIAELQIQYAVSKTMATNAVEAYVVTGRVKVI